MGEDQVPHLWDTNNIARAFNRTYKNTFVECKPLVSEFGRLVGTNGQAKMSKSLGNAIYLKDSEEEIKKKVMSMFTDPKRIRPIDPGTVEGNPVFIYHDAFNTDKEEVADLKKRHKKGTVGDVEVKQKLNIALQEFLKPIREKRHLSEGTDLKKILNDGTTYAREIAKETLERTKSAMHIDYYNM